MTKHLHRYLRASKAPSPTVDFSGTWRNQHGSEMRLTVSRNSVKGKFRTGVGQPSPKEEFDLLGFVSADLIVFTVNFGAYGSLATWAGQHTVEKKLEKIETLWHLARNVREEEEPEELWGAILTGADVFVRGPGF